MNTKIITKNELSEAAAMIRGGGIVVMPTETVYGLAANALDANAVKKVFEAKGRQSDNPLIVHIANIADWAQLVTEIPPEAKLLAERFWPGPLTIILKKSELVPDIVSGGLDTVAVRMPKNKIAFRFIKECGVPIAAPSANLSGSPSPTKLEHVLADMNGKVDGIIDGGDCMVGIESTVITLTTPVPTILRPGRITAEQIRKVIGEVAIDPAVKGDLAPDQKAASPGMKYKHYAPKAELTLIKAADEDFITYIKEHANEQTAVICYNEMKARLTGMPLFTIGAKEDSVMQAKRLFDVLRRIDEKGFHKAFAPLPQEKGVGLALKNRLLRAAGFRVIDLEAAEEPIKENLLVQENEEAATEPLPEEIEEEVQIIGLEAEANASVGTTEPAKESVEVPAETPVQDSPAMQTMFITEPVDGSAEIADEPDNAYLEGLEILEEDSAILALNDVKLSADFDEDFSSEISQCIVVVEKTDEDDPTKIFYEAVLDESDPKPAAYPVDFIEDDFQFDVYDDDIEAERNKGILGFFRKRRKKKEEENEPEPFIPARNPVWNADKPLKKDHDLQERRKPKAGEDAVFERIEGLRVVGLTGKSGAGKSYIAKKMAAKTPASAIIDADSLYHTMLYSATMINLLVGAFGEGILSGKQVDRKKLAAIAFESTENLEKLNQTVLPVVAQEIIKLLEHAKQKGLKTVFIDAPTLIESKLYQVCDEVIFVVADAAIRQERIVNRDNITLDEVGQRMRFEKDDSFYVRYADRIIRNN